MLPRYCHRPLQCAAPPDNCVNGTGATSAARHSRGLLLWQELLYVPGAFPYVVSRSGPQKRCARLGREDVVRQGEATVLRDKYALPNLSADRVKYLRGSARTSTARGLPALAVGAMRVCILTQPRVLFDVSYYHRELDL